MISVIMPAYNAQDYIEMAIQSVRQQTLEDWELLVIDDCSADRTRQLVQNIGKEEKRLRYLCNEKNRGAAYCRNLGVREAKGEWIAFLDSDDMWEKEKLELQMECVRNHSCSFVFTGSAFVDEKGNRKSYILRAKDITSYKELLKQNIISCSSVLIKREWMLEFPMSELEGIHEDLEAWVRILKEKQCSAYAVDRPLLTYRIRRQSKSGNKLKSAMMHLRVCYRTGEGVLGSLIFLFIYILRGLKKYKNLA